MNKKKIIRTQAGFTIIELLLVIMVMLFVGGIISSIFIVSLRSSKKSNTIAVVRQSGNSVIEKMSRKIRYAQSVKGLGPGFISACSDSTVLPPIPTYQYIKLETDDVTNPIIYYCPSNLMAGSNEPMQTGASVAALLPMTDPLVAKVKDCKISCVKQGSGATTVNIQFKMTDPNEGAGLIESSVQPITFDTSITLRNF